MSAETFTIPIKDACKALQCSETTLRRIASHGQGLKIRYISNRPIIVKTELDAFLANLPTSPTNRRIIAGGKTLGVRMGAQS